MVDVTVQIEVVHPEASRRSKSKLEIQSSKTVKAPAVEGVGYMRESGARGCRERARMDVGRRDCWRGPRDARHMLACKPVELKNDSGKRKSKERELEEANVPMLLYIRSRQTGSDR